MKISTEDKAKLRIWCMEHLTQEIKKSRLYQKFTQGFKRNSRLLTKETRNNPEVKKWLYDLFWGEKGEVEKAMKAIYTPTLTMLELSSEKYLNYEFGKDVIRKLTRRAVKSYTPTLREKLRELSNYDDSHWSTNETFHETYKSLCERLNRLSFQWFMDSLRGQRKSITHRPYLLIETEKKYEISLDYPGYSVSSLSSVAKKHNIEYKAFGRFLDKIKFPYIYKLRNFVGNGQDLTLVDENKLLSCWFLIGIYFDRKKNYKNWARLLNEGHSRFRGLALMKRKIGKIVPNYYFDIVPPTEENKKHLLECRKEKATKPIGIWKKALLDSYTHKKLAIILQAICSKSSTRFDYKADVIKKTVAPESITT